MGLAWDGLQWPPDGTDCGEADLYRHRLQGGLLTLECVARPHMCHAVLPTGRLCLTCLPSQVRVLKPGGTLVIATWCQREETPEAPFRCGPWGALAGHRGQTSVRAARRQPVPALGWVHSWCAILYPLLYLPLPQRELPGAAAVPVRGVGAPLLCVQGGVRPHHGGAAHASNAHGFSAHARGFAGTCTAAPGLLLSCLLP